LRYLTVERSQVDDLPLHELAPRLPDPATDPSPPERIHSLKNRTLLPIQHKQSKPTHPTPPPLKLLVRVDCSQADGVPPAWCDARRQDGRLVRPSWVAVRQHALLGDGLLLHAQVSQSACQSRRESFKSALKGLGSRGGGLTYGRVGHDRLELGPEGVDRLKSLADDGDVLNIAVEEVHVGNAPPERLQPSGGGVNSDAPQTRSSRAEGGGRGNKPRPLQRLGYHAHA